MFIPDNLIEAAWTTLVQARGLDKSHRPAIHSHLSKVPHLTSDNIHPCLGTRQTHRPLLIKTTTPNIRYSPSTLDNLFHPQAGSEIGGLIYCPGSTKYTWHTTWHSETRVNPPHQPCNKSTDTQPLAVGLPN